MIPPEAERWPSVGMAGHRVAHYRRVRAVADLDPVLRNIINRPLALSIVVRYHDGRPLTIRQNSAFLIVE